MGLPVTLATSARGAPGRLPGARVGEDCRTLRKCVCVDFGMKAAEPPRATCGRASRRSTAAAAAGGISGPLAGDGTGLRGKMFHGGQRTYGTSRSTVNAATPV